MKNYLLLIFTVLLLVSCKTYIVSTQSFSEQFGNVDYDFSYSKTVISGPIYYNGYQIKYLKVIDKNGDEVKIENAPYLEMRITLKNGKRKIMYFDSVKLQNDTLTGHKSRFLPKLVVKVPFDDIIKIEIQDSGKKLKYTEIN